MKSIAVLTLIALSFPALATPQQEWLAPLPASASEWPDSGNVPNNAFFEVPSDKFAAAEQHLSASAAVLQADSAFKRFGRPDFRCPASTKPYLVRAYTDGNRNGVFNLHWAGNNLVVFYGSLGGGNPPVRSALVACLSKDPSAVFSLLSSAL